MHKRVRFWTRIQSKRSEKITWKAGKKVTSEREESGSCVFTEVNEDVGEEDGRQGPARHRASSRNRQGFRVTGRLGSLLYAS